jgi:N-acetylglucosaminyldiphosphoundecaprenol N-acetyl-beta-D-mannosaminyltransferase
MLITTVNAHSFNLAQNDKIFANALSKSDILLPDGISIVLAFRILKGEKINKIAGADLFYYEMDRLNSNGGRCMFLGSNEHTLMLIRNRIGNEYPNVEVFTYSPPYKKEFSDEDNDMMISSVNTHRPDVLFIGMTAPKQEKWAYHHFDKLEVGHICCIGAVFDFYSLQIKRAPDSFIKYGLEWLYRLCQEPKRMWRRYFLGNTKFIWLVLKEWFLYQ